MGFTCLPGSLDRRLFAEESADGVDRNGDGDTNDTVLRVARVRL